MRIDLLRRRALVEGHEPLQQVRARGIVVVAPCVVREVVPQWRFGQLLSEKVDLVQEKDLQSHERWQEGGENVSRTLLRVNGTTTE